MASPSTSTLINLSTSSSKSKRTSDTQRILTSIALSRPLPYGQIPVRRRPSLPQSSNQSAGSGSSSPPDVNLSGIEGFDYNENWGFHGNPFHSAATKSKGKGRAIEGSDTSPSLPIEGDEDNGVPLSKSSLSRSSTASSSRSSARSRRPRLLQQSISPPVASPQLASAVGRASISARGSKSLADPGEGSALPSLYHVSRGRSTNVSPSRMRRGTSASVLSGASGSGSGEDKADTILRREAGKGGRRKECRKGSGSSLETPLFSSDDGFSTSEDEADLPSHSVSRRSSMDKDRRRGLKVLLAPSEDRMQFFDKHKSNPDSLITDSSEERATQDDRLKGKSSSNITEDVLEHSDGNKQTTVQGSEMADDESDQAISTSALLRRRRSRSGRRLLGSILSSTSSQYSTNASKLEVILAGLTPDGQSDPLSSIPAIKATVPVDNDADPLLGSTIGSVADMIDVDAIEWNDQQKSNSPSQSSISLEHHRRQSVAEQEKNRRMGFAAAYQQRLSSLLWSSKERKPVKRRSDVEEKVEEEGGESLLTSGWRHLTTLPNFLLMPTLGPSRTRALIDEEASQEAKREEALSAAQEAAAAQVPSLPSTPDISSSVTSSSSTSTKSAIDAGWELATKRKGRGVMTPLQGDSDVSAYVPGLGLPIDPDLELSSVVHLQTFRTKSTSSQSRSRRGSLEKPTSVDAGTIHRRSYSDNVLEPPSAGLTLDGRRLDLFKWNPFVSRVSSVDVPVVVEEGVRKCQGQDGGDRERRSSRTCSRPAVPAPVPGNYSAYESSGSEEEVSSKHNNVEDDGRILKSREGASGRGRKKRSRLRSSSPPPNRMQVAVGLFHSQKPGRESHHTSKKAGGGRKSEETAADDAVHVLRVKSTPNLASMTSKESHDRHERQSDGRGRGGSVKVVSVSYAKEKTASKRQPTTVISGGGRNSESLSRSSSPSPNRASLGLGLPGGQVCSRPSMVSNGAHLLMLSLELEMMRNRKITCSLKPRWLKARFRSEGPIRSAALPVNLDDGGVEAASAPASSPVSCSSSKPRLGSSLRFEVVPHHEDMVARV